MHTPITYYGGKQKLAKQLLQLVPLHSLYCEPFMGGGALFFAKQPSKAEIINDLDGNVTNFYSVAQSQFTELKKLVDGTLHSRGIHTKAKKVYNNPAEYTNITRAWAFWVVTNQGFSGKIGSWALSRDGNIGKTLANKREQFTREYAERLKGVQIESKDALEIIKQYDSPETFFYLDPPYFNSDCGHYKKYKETDYKSLLDTLVNIKGKFLLSSYPSGILNRYISKYGWHHKEFKQNVSITTLTKKKKTEVLIWNYDIENGDEMYIQDNEKMQIPENIDAYIKDLVKEAAEAITIPLQNRIKELEETLRIKNAPIMNEGQPSDVIHSLDTESGQIALQNALQKALQSQKHEEAPKYLTMSKAAAYIGKSIKTMEYYILQANKKRLKHPIPFHQPLGKGTGIYFEKTELDAWLVRRS